MSYDFCSVLALCLSAAINITLNSFGPSTTNEDPFDRLVGVKIVFLGGVRRLRGGNATAFILVPLV